MDDGLLLDERTIAEALRDSSYATWLVGKWHAGHWGSERLPLQRGFDHHYGFYTGFIDSYKLVRPWPSDLEDGNPEKGLSGGVGSGAGNWRLLLDSELEFEVLSYIRTGDGLLTAMHDVAPSVGGEYRVAIFNPGRNPHQVSGLRLVNPGDGDAAVTIAGTDDSGASSASEVSFGIPAGKSVTLTALELEKGGEGLVGRLGEGMGKWRLTVRSQDFLARLAALVPRPRANLTRYHGVLAPNSPFRRAVVPGSAHRVRKQRNNSATPAVAESAVDRDWPTAPLTWAERLKRVFDIDISVCPLCGGTLRVIAMSRIRT